jgi:DNA-directed RNA polymerase subunit RPC12/RpoP
MTTQLCAVEDCDREVPEIEYVCAPCGARLKKLLDQVGDRPAERPWVLSMPHMPAHDRCPDCGRGIPGHPLINTVRQTGLPRTELGLAGDLEVSMSKPSLTVDVQDGKAKVALPYGYRPAEARWTLRDALTAVGDEIARVRGLFKPLNSMPALAAWLGSQVEWMRHQPAGGDLIGDLTAALRQAIRAIDNMPAPEQVGVCDAPVIDGHGYEVACGEPLYVRRGDAEVQCPACGTNHLADDTWNKTLAAAEDLLLTRSEIARALAGQVTVKQLEHWADPKRGGRLVAKGWTATRPARPRYRLGDVRDLIAQTSAASA